MAESTANVYMLQGKTYTFLFPTLKTNIKNEWQLRSEIFFGPDWGGITSCGQNILGKRIIVCVK